MSEIIILSYPKSGSTWLARLLGDILDSPVGSAYPYADSSCIATEGQDRTGKYHIRQGHSIPVDVESDLVIPVMGQLAYKNLTDERVIYMTRDPRDVIVSAHHHWRHDKPMTETIEMAATGTFPLSWGGGLIHYLQIWEDAPFDYLTTTYEDLLADTIEEVKRLLQGIRYGPIRMRLAIRRQSFSERKKWTLENGKDLNYGLTFQYNFLRRGQVGSWRDEMNMESRFLMQKYFGDWMLSHNYIKGLEWIDES